MMYQYFISKIFSSRPSVKKQSGFLKPEINQSDILGGSFFNHIIKIFQKIKILQYHQLGLTKVTYLFRMSIDKRIEILISWQILVL